MPSIFEKYDLKQVINTSGRMTILGVSTPRPEVVEAAMAGMNQYFEMKDCSAAFFFALKSIKKCITGLPDNALCKIN